MKVTKIELVVLAVVVAALWVSIYFYPQMPDKMASHWNARGQVDGYLPKAVNMFIIPSILAGLALFFAVIVRLPMLREKITPFRKYYDGFILCLSLFLLAVHYWMILWNLGICISPNHIFPFGIGLLIFYVGLICKHIQPNPIMGIRTPWTFKNEAVWAKTHKLGGNLFMFCGVVLIAGAFFACDICFLTVISVLSAALITVVYSYLVYRQEMSAEREGSPEGLGSLKDIAAHSPAVFLQRHRCLIVDSIILPVVILPYAVVILIAIASKASPMVLVVLGISGLLLLAFVATYMGGLIYEIAYGKLVIKSGLLRITLERIPLADISHIEAGSYNVFKSVAWGWHNKFPDGSKGYVRGFKGDAVIIHTDRQKYLLASENPADLKAKIERSLRPQK